MAISTYVKVKRDGTLVLKDSGGANTYTLSYEDGDIKFDNPKAEQIVIMDRGVFAGVRKGNDTAISGSFTVNFRQWASAATENLCDVLDGVNSASGWTKVDTAYEQFNLDAVFTIDGGIDGTDSVATLSTCIFEWSFSEGDPDKLSCTFTCYGGSVYTGPA